MTDVTQEVEMSDVSNRVLEMAKMLHESHVNMSNVSNSVLETLDTYIAKWLPLVILTAGLLYVVHYSKCVIVCYLLTYACTLLYNGGCLFWYSRRYYVTTVLQAVLNTDTDYETREEEIRQCVDINTSFPFALDLLQYTRVIFAILSLICLIFTCMG